MKPYLPEKNVKKVLVSELLPEYMREKLADLGIGCVNAAPAKNITTELKYHPDVVMLNVSEDVWYAEKSNEQMFDFGEVRRLESDLEAEYPFDCLLNDIVFGDNVICGKSAPEWLFEGKNVYRVRQGYAKCSTVFVSDNAFITSDTGIYKTLCALGCEALCVTNVTIRLNGYSCGFIGGCAGKLAGDLLAFTGDINTHPDTKKIKAFCKKQNVKIISLGDGALYDYGGMIPLCEY